VRRFGIGLALVGLASAAAPAGAQQTGTAAEIHHVHGLAVDRYVHRASTGLMRSRDAGATWEPAGLHTGPDAPVIARATGPRERVVAATTAADIVRSTDGGRTWTRLVERGRARADAR